MLHTGDVAICLVLLNLCHAKSDMHADFVLSQECGLVRGASA
jgi:hypothetical protein